MPKLKNSKLCGFTLVEVLITLTVISFLAAVGLVVYSNVMQQGRNSTRQADLRSIQSALEQYYSDQFFYPTAISFDSPLKNSTGNPNSVSPGKTYLNNVPEDPTGTVKYAYTTAGAVCDNVVPSGTKCEKYCIYAKLEGVTTSQIPSTCPADATRNFAVTLP